MVTREVALRDAFTEVCEAAIRLDGRQEDVELLWQKIEDLDVAISEMSHVLHGPSRSALVSVVSVEQPINPAPIPNLGLAMVDEVRRNHS